MAATSIAVDSESTTNTPNYSNFDWHDHAFVGEFSFKYVSAKRDRDLRGIPKVFADERLDE